MWHEDATEVYKSKNQNLQFSCSVMSDSATVLTTQHTRPPCPSPTARVPNPRPFNQWCHPTISSSVVPFSCPQSFPASESFPMSQFFASDGQGIRVSASVFPMNIQDWFPLGVSGLISLLPEDSQEPFSNTIIQKHQFFSTQLYLWSNFHIHTSLLEKP